MAAIRTHILGTGAYAPEKVVTNRDLEKIVATSDEWIVERTGIRERRQAAPGETTSDMCLKAAVRALEMAKTRPEDLDLIVLGTVTPDQLLPSAATLLQAKLGAKKAFAFDVVAACAGSLYAMSIADKYVCSGGAKRVLVVGAEMLTSIVNWEDRGTCVLFGDAAGAMVLGPSPDPERGILSTHLHSDGTLAEILQIPGGGTAMPSSSEVIQKKLNKVQMNGREVFKVAVRSLVDVMHEAAAANQVSISQIDHVVAHQANLRIIELVMKKLEIPLEKCVLNIERFGNTSSASLPATLDEANRAGRLKPGDLIGMMAIGAGMAWGGALVRW